MSKKKDSFKPWLSRPTVNRSVTLPLTRPLTQRLSNLNEFHPNELDPYLLFDAQDSMIGTLENPTLDLDPSKPDTLNVITATRAGTATYTDVNGNIATAPANTVRVDQTQGAELTPTKFQNIGYTDFANSYWTARGFTKVGAVDGPLGYTGYEFLENNTNSNPSVFINTDLSDGSFQTFGVWLKASSPISIAFATTGSNQTATINITTEWQFFSCTDNYNATTGPFISGFGTITRGSGVRLYAAMPQLEEGTTASDFVENTTGSPKFITGPTFGPRVPMILVEPSATNLITYSEDFSNAAWLNNAVGTGVAPVVTLNAAESPDGTQNATKIVFDSGSGTTSNDLSTLEDLFSTTSGASYTQSIYLKGETGGEKILVRNAGNSAYTTITLTTEWARYDVTETANLSFAYFSIGLRQGLGGVVMNSKITVYAYGAQVEAGSVSTSYIPTSGSTAQRAKDDLVISGSDFDFYNQSEGTLYVEYEPRDVTSFTSALFNFSDGTTTNRILSLVHPSYNLFIATSGVTVAQFGGGTPQANTLNRVAATFKANDARLSLNGANEVTDTSLTTPSVNQLHIGQRTNLVHQLNGHIKRLIYWPYHSDSL